MRGLGIPLLRSIGLSGEVGVWGCGGGFGEKFRVRVEGRGAFLGVFVGFGVPFKGSCGYYRVFLGFREFGA